MKFKLTMSMLVSSTCEVELLQDGSLHVRWPNAPHVATHPFGTVGPDTTQEAVALLQDPERMKAILPIVRATLLRSALLSTEDEIRAAQMYTEATSSEDPPKEGPFN